MSHSLVLPHYRSLLKHFLLQAGHMLPKSVLHFYRRMDGRQQCHADDWVQRVAAKQRQHHVWFAYILQGWLRF